MGVEDYKNSVDEAAAANLPGPGHNQPPKDTEIHETLLELLQVQTNLVREYNALLMVIFLELAREGGPNTDTMKVVADRYQELSVQYLKAMMGSSST